MEKLDKKVIHKMKWFDVIQVGTMLGIEPNKLNVVIMPYERDLRGLPKAIGVLKEYNPMRENYYNLTLITGGTEEEDPDILTTAMRELKEESGYDVTDPDRWYYLGFITGSKMVMCDHPCFAVDITGLTPGEKTGDGSKGEDKSEFIVMPVKQALATNDCFIPALFMKIFRFIFGFGNEEPTQEELDPQNKPSPDVDALKGKLDMQFLNLNGVIQSVVKIGDDGKECIEYQVKEITEEMEKLIPKEVKGVKIILTVISPGSAMTPDEPAEQDQPEQI